MKGKRFLVGGASGLIGSKLVANLKSLGAEVSVLARPSSKPAKDMAMIPWDPDRGVIQLSDLENFDGIIHLGGKNIADGYWTEKRKAELRQSRIESTSILSKAIAQLKNPPSIFLCASAIGFYGNRGNDTLDEMEPKGEGFLADLVKDWEGAAVEAQRSGTRVVFARFGLVLSKEGGALKKMLPAFKFGLGGPLGDGTQYMSWISVADAVQALTFCLEQDQMVGPVNLTSPNPLTNKNFSKVLAQTVSRPSFFSVPSFGIELIMGELGTELLLSSTRAIPKKLQDANFKFKHEDLSDALLDVLK